MKATWNGEVVADSDDTVVIEGVHYFPRAAVREDVLRPSDKHTVCPWKGRASYFSLEIDGQVAQDAAWYYPDPKPDAKAVRDRIGFRRDINVGP
jgi:uncharacterized protein (DUF427 family)